ncbi:hypothetical protein X975_14369, partial [Stegodyphus mimosarum]
MAGKKGRKKCHCVQPTRNVAALSLNHISITLINFAISLCQFTTRIYFTYSKIEIVTLRLDGPE